MGCIHIRIKRNRNGKGEIMNTLEDLIDALGKEKVDSLLMEYLLLQLSKAMK